MPERSRFGFGLTVAAIALVLDQMTKWVVLTELDHAVRVTSFFNLVLVWNRGVSFGMLDAAGASAPWLLAGVAIAVVVGLSLWLWRTDEWLVALGLGLVIGGALGNVIDRVRYGAVVDFLDFHVAGWHWPAFNVADSAICVGAAVLLVDGLFAARRDYT